MSFRLQDPDESLSYSVDWTDWLDAADSVASSDWSAVPAASVGNLGFSGAVSTGVLGGLTRGATYQFTCTVTTRLGRVGQRSHAVRCDAR